MRRSLIKKRRYYFTDDSVASDTIIAYVIAGLCLGVELIGFIASVATKGNTPEVFGILYLCAVVLSITGILFGIFGHRAQEGGVTGKRTSILLNIVALVVPIATFISGLI